MKKKYLTKHYWFPLQCIICGIDAGNSQTDRQHHMMDHEENYGRGDE